MAISGKRPKSAALRLVDGTHRPARHGGAAKAREEVDDAVAAFGRLVQPSHLKGDGLKAWKRWIVPAGWLDGSKEAAAIAFCELWQEFRFSPTGFPAAKHGQMRAYMAELGLTDERNRKAGGDEKPRDEFDD